MRDFIINNSNYFVTTTFGEFIAKEMNLDNVKLDFACAILQMLDRYTKENGKKNNMDYESILITGGTGSLAKHF